MKISIGFSPCPNDTFIFDAMVHGKIDTEGLAFEPVMADVEALNRMAFEGRLEVTKLSFHAWGHCLDRYVLLDAGSALGNNCGPLLISRRPAALEDVADRPIAIPGRYTTANFLLSLALPRARNRKEYLFSEIEDAVLAGEADFGLIIHENRFTYRQKGLHKVIDLGEFWEQRTGMPIPLGGIVVRRDLPKGLQAKINRVMRRSVEWAFAHPEETMPFVRAHAQEMDEEVMKSHIGLYVTEYTRDLGDKGRVAVQQLFDRAWQLGVIPPFDGALFLDG